MRYIDFADVAAGIDPQIYLFAGFFGVIVLSMVVLMVKDGEFSPVPIIVGAAALACAIVVLTDREIKKLNYPSAEPEEVSPIWNGERFELAQSSDGETFVPLETRS